MLFYKRILFFNFLFGLGIINTLLAQTPGCTDPAANNYNAAATINNGACTYATQSYNPVFRANLNTTTVREISGMVYFNGKILALNDGDNGNLLFMLDTATGAVMQTITVEGAVNIDWEDMAQDSSYVYVGDFGNNANGNRTNLAIYRINRSAFFQAGNFTIPSSAVEKINFSYPDQTDFAGSGNNNTKFDCEGFVARRGKLHLFTKNWIGNISTHYMLPTTPGTYVATRLDSLNTGGIMITGASLGGDDEILLTGYSKSAACAFFLIYGFDETDYFFNTGNKRQLQLPSALSTGQLESVCFVNATHGFIANEYQVFGGLITVVNKLQTFNALNWILPYYQHNPKPPFITEPGMIRFNTTSDKYELFNGYIWESFKGQ